MQPTHLLHETPRQRLLRLESNCPPFRSTARNPTYLTAAALLFVMLTIVAAGILLVTFGSEFLGPHLRLIEKLASPYWR